MTKGSKYQPLLDYLFDSNQREVKLSFAQIELSINHKLPDSARRSRQWWGNRKKGGLQASAWLGAGYRVCMFDLEAETVTFRKQSNEYIVERQDGDARWNAESIKAMRLHMGLTQTEFAKKIGVRQQTVSEWEKNVYLPARSLLQHLSLVAEQVGFKFREGV